MSTLTVLLPDEDLAFLRARAEMLGTSAETLSAEQARNLREHLQRPPHPDVLAASGIVVPELDAQELHRAYLERKYR